MASKKDKLLESAQRYVLKGQIDKAIKDYQQLVSLDPREVRFRQRLAELLVRDNRKEEAIVQYEDIGKHYADNSYFLKAIAVYKQIQRLDSANATISHTLASLNHRQGLTGNALAEYAQTITLLEQQGDLPQAVKVVQEMLAVDGENVTALTKNAELLFATGVGDASYKAFSDLFKKLAAGGDEAGARQVSDRMGELFPGNEEHEVELLSMKMEQGDVDGAIATLRKTLSRSEANLSAWRLLLVALRKKGEPGEVRAALARMVELFPGELSVLREVMGSNVEAGEFETVASLLKAHLEEFIAADAAGELEPIFLALPAALRAEPALRSALMRLYEATGDWDKLGALQGSAATAQVAPPAVPPAAVVNALEHVQASWEEEIELDFDEPPTQEAELSLDLKAPAAPPVSTVGGGDAPLELDWPEEPVFLTPEENEPRKEDQGELELGELPWPEEPEHFTEAEDAGAGADMADLELDPLAFDLGEAPELEFTPEESEQTGGVDFLSPEPSGALPADLPPDSAAGTPSDLSPEEFGDLDLGAFELSLTDEEPALEGEELTLEGEELTLEEPALTVAEAEIAGAPAVTWEDLFPGCLEGEGGLDLEDAESHYDLGIAYLEMGRPAAAMKEFDVAAANPRRRLDCLILKGMCYRDKGEMDQAEELLSRGLLVAGLSQQERLTLTYEVAAMCEAKGAQDRAVALYREISAVDPTFRDVAAKLSDDSGAEPIDIIDLELEDVL